ncbi:RNA-binding transcriptional accessory protein [Ktedonobacter sp. SOSP1-85]|uniref:Tex family protein n=1 Tax=Ktedonobacter sp. SOSP1-85 TaxID=2778367 RepID=UPI0019155E57|nr:Tex family protein [Ktedonobacter sp. SOSP1-85]GHO77306.1 RNA-binding transcriptional accessory protein [Ktedonobacter sp. SOSP1-85]
MTTEDKHETVTIDSAKLEETTLSPQEIAAQLSSELNLQRGQVERTLGLLDEGNTIPFIARYRKEVTGSLDEVQIQAIADRAASLRALHERKQDVRRLIDGQGKLTPELATAIEEATTLQAVEDLYLPYRQKRKTRASVAREKGLAPLAEIILQQPEISGDVEAILEEHAAPFLNAEKGVDTSLEAFAGAADIVAEMIAEDASVRGDVRAAYFKQSSLKAKALDEEELKAKDPQGVYQLYYDFNEDVTKLVPHRVLALNRAEREGILRVGVNLAYEQAKGEITRHYPARATSPFQRTLEEAMEDGYKRLLAPAMEREVRVELTKKAEEHAIHIFAANLRNLLLQPPLRGKMVLGLDPGYRTGCKVTLVDETGKYLLSDTVYLHQEEKAKRVLHDMLIKHQVKVVAIGNGTASRETEQLVASVISTIEEERGQHGEIGYVLVNEAGASVYSASEAAREEFPTLDATQRGTISIARRLQDPLAELVKIDPKAVGVGLYQHDVDQKELAEMLDRVVVSCVNFAGVEVNSASSALLKHVSGINTRVANAIVKHREAHGPFKSRDELKKVSGLGPATFVQAAGFLKIGNAVDSLDNTFIHPESYEAARALLNMLPGDQKQKPSERIAQFKQLIKLQHSFGRSSRGRGEASDETEAWKNIAKQIGVGMPTLHDILENLEKPGLDPRDALPAPILRHDVLKMEDLQPGMILQGTVRNVVDFGAFVDIGVKQDGLVHISELAERFVKDPLTVVAVGQVVSVRVLSIDLKRNRVQLSMRNAKQ